MVGLPALNQYTLDPDNTVRSIKRKMGYSERVTLGNRDLTPQEVSAFILRELKAIAEEALGQPNHQRTDSGSPSLWVESGRRSTGLGL